MASVTLEKVNKVFGRDHIIKDVDLSIGDGEFVVFVGPSGCGKSTLLRLIAGLESITDGDLNIGGTVVNDLPPRARRRHGVSVLRALPAHDRLRQYGVWS
ncbi:hypothetical protein HAALTHF_42980n [Vreelandella aquamarina]|nr:hypothetical protein HAALTHF_42980n [Halomonas axialensis]